MDYIERQCVIDILEKYKTEADYYLIDLIELNVLVDIPSVDVEPVKTGEWIIVKGKYESFARCTYCGKTSIDQSTYISMNYCPVCGAVMKGVYKE